MDTPEAQVVVVRTNRVPPTQGMEAVVQQVKVMQEEILAVAAVVKYLVAEAEAPEVLDRMVHLAGVEVQHIDHTILVTVVTDFKIQFLVLLCGTLEAVEAVVLVRARIFKVQMALVVDKPPTVVVDSVK